MEHTRFLIVGAGVTGLAMAGALPGQDLLVLEKEAEVGGYCRTVERGPFVWDYSGHFLHFRHPEIERHVRSLLPPGALVTVQKVCKVYHRGILVDYPFQRNIHQLSRADFLDCLYHLYFRPSSSAPRSFEQRIHQEFGEGIARRFLLPYNTKLYACDLANLDPEAMGRFLPPLAFDDVMRQLKDPDNGSYNSTFLYPRGGAVQFVRALASQVPPEQLRLGEGLVSLDLERRTALTTRGAVIAWEQLISTAPLPSLLRRAGVPHDVDAFTHNKVVVFNLGFDRKGWEGVHWVYFPDPELAFYRVGFYDNITEGAPQMSLYVEVGCGPHERPDLGALRARVLEGLREVGIVTDHRLVAEHHVVMDPAYVHMSGRSREEAARVRGWLAERGVHSIGRYGRWTYCSMEDNVVEARELAHDLAQPARRGEVQPCSAA